MRLVVLRAGDRDRRAAAGGEVRPPESQQVMGTTGPPTGPTGTPWAPRRTARMAVATCGRSGICPDSPAIPRLQTLVALGWAGWRAPGMIDEPRGDRLGVAGNLEQLGGARRHAQNATRSPASSSRCARTSQRAPRCFHWAPIAPRGGFGQTTASSTATGSTSKPRSTAFSRTRSWTLSRQGRGGSAAAPAHSRGGAR